jgi:hypothetical protein
MLIIQRCLLISFVVAVALFGGANATVRPVQCCKASDGCASDYCQAFVARNPAPGLHD